MTSTARCLARTQEARRGERTTVRDPSRATEDTARRRAVPSGDLTQFLGLAQRLQLFEALVLDLADPLAGDVEGAADLVQGPRVLAAEPVAELEHAALAVGEVLERLFEGLFGKQVRGPIERALGLLVGDELAELRLLLVADRLLERDRGLGGALDRVDLLGIDPRHLGNLLWGGLAAQLGDQLALGAADLVQLLDDVDRDPDRARLVGQRPGDRLADPPGRVGGELEPLAVVELLRRTDQAQRPLLDQIEEGQALVAVIFRDRDDKPEVRLDHFLLRVEVAALDTFGEFDLLRRGQQADFADVLEEQLQGVGGHVRFEVERLFLAPAPFFAGVRGERFGGGFLRRIHVLDELDPRLLEVAVEVLDVGLVEIDLRNSGGDVAEGQHAELLPAIDEAFDLVQFLKLCYQHRFLLVSLALVI